MIGSARRASGAAIAAGIFLVTVSWNLTGCVPASSGGGGAQNAFDRPADDDEDPGGADDVAADNENGADDEPANGTAADDETAGENDNSDAGNDNEATEPDEPTDPDEPLDERTEALRVETDLDHVKGDPEAAPNVIIEYGNFVTPDCATFFADSLPGIEALVAAGRVAFVYRHRPPLFAEVAEAAEAAECAALQSSEAFFPYHDLLFENPHLLSTAQLPVFAADLGLDLTQFEACIADRSAAERVERDRASAVTLDVTVVPTFFVNGEVLEGLQTLEQIEALLVD